VATAVVDMKTGAPYKRGRALENIHQDLAHAGRLATMYVPK